MIKDKLIAVTGHSREGRLGHSIFNYFSANNKVKGYSRSNGWDIRNDPDAVINDSLDCDIFINCCCSTQTNDIPPIYDGWNGDAEVRYEIIAQENIARKWYEAHKDKNHVIVNISCLIPYLKFVMDWSNEKAKMPFDSYDKYLINKVSFEINTKANSAKSIDVAPGMMKFNTSSSHYLEKVKAFNAEVKHETMIESIEFAIDQFFKGALIPYIGVANTPFTYDFD